MCYCDDSESVISWGSEEIIVPYKSPIDNKMHRYFVDFIVETKQHDGSKAIQLIEIKPKKQCKPPKTPVRKTRRYISEVRTWESIQQSGRPLQNMLPVEDGFLKS